jgi:hypothetical protein
MRQGHVVFSPIAMESPGTDCRWTGDSGGGNERRVLEARDAIVVLTLWGRQASAGVQAETRVARKMGNPVSFLQPITQR